MSEQEMREILWESLTRRDYAALADEIDQVASDMNIEWVIRQPEAPELAYFNYLGNDDTLESFEAATIAAAEKFQEERRKTT